MAELGQDPRSPDWRPVLNLHLTTLFGALEENVLSVIQSYSVHLIFFHAPTFPFKSVTVRVLVKLETLKAAILGRHDCWITALRTPSFHLVVWLPCKSAPNLPGQGAPLARFTFYLCFCRFFCILSTVLKTIQGTPRPTTVLSLILYVILTVLT